MLLLRNINLSEMGKEGRYDSFVSGLMGGYVVFGKNRGAVSKQVHKYSFTLPSLPACRYSQA